MMQWTINLANKTAIVIDTDSNVTRKGAFGSASVIDIKGEQAIDVDWLLLEPVSDEFPLAGNFVRQITGLKREGDRITFQINFPFKTLDLFPPAPTSCLDCRFFHGRSGVNCGLYPAGKQDCQDKETQPWTVDLELYNDRSFVIDGRTVIQFSGDKGDRFVAECILSVEAAITPSIESTLMSGEKEISKVEFPECFAGLSFSVFSKKYDRWFDGVLGDHSLVERSSQ